MNIRTLNQTLGNRLGLRQAERLTKLGRSRLMRKSKSRRRLVRYGILSLNVIVLALVVMFVIKTPDSAKITKQSAQASGSSAKTASNPLDQLSSADIAAHVAQITRLPEAVAVSNQADSVNAELTVASVDDKVIAKPQVVNTSTKTRKDIQKYVTKDGDTITNLASKFGVTSDSIRWSNGVTGDRLTVGKELWISPVSDGIVYLVKSGDSAQSLADKFHANKDVITSFNDAEVSGLPVGERIVIPGGGSFSASFNWFGAGAIYAGNRYDFGYCTWYAYNRRAEIGRPVPGNLGNANTWYINGVRYGLSTGITPAVGAVAVEYGINHVSVVEQVNDDGSFVVSEMNYGGWNRRTERLIKSVGSVKFVY